MSISGCSGGSRPATEWIRVTSSAASGSSGGRIPGSRRASIVLPVPGRPAEQEVVPACRGELERTPGALLTPHLGEVGERRRRVDPCREHRIGLLLAAEVRDRVGEMADGDRLDARELRLGSALGRTEQPVEPQPARPLGDREDAADTPHAAVEGELADGGVPLELVVRHLARRREHGERDRQVEPGAFLAQLRRREVDRDAAAGELELGREDAAADALPGLLAGAVGEPDDREGGDAVLDVRLDLDPARIETDERVGDRACEHASTLRGQP